MEAYSEFARVYDTFMEETPYEKWVNYINECMKKYNITPNIVCDLGCGTGKMTTMFAKQGIDMIGIDNSEEMLMVARENAYEDELNILYLMQDMSQFELYGTVDLIYSACDCMNYLLDEKDVLSTLKWVNNYLEPEGLLVFDINTPYKYKEVLGNRVFAQQEAASAYIWENYYDEEKGINEYEVSFFIQDEEDGRYDRAVETHYQRAYSVERMIELIKEAGLEFIGAYDEYSFNPVREDSQRVTFIAREQGKRKEVK